MACFETVHCFCTRVRRSWSCWMVLLLAAVAMPGCNYVVLAGYLIGGPPSIEPHFDATMKKSMTDKDVTVAVVCYALPELKWDFDQVDREVSKYVARRLVQHKIKVIRPDSVQEWLDTHDDWDRPEEIGAHFGTTYVVYIDLHKYSLYEENSANLYRGRSEALVSVFEMDEDDEGEKIYSKEIVSRYPLSVPRSTSEITYGRFKKQYLSRLSEEIGRLFYEHYNGDDMADAT